MERTQNQQVSFPGTVHGIGHDGIEAGRRYAALTGRGFQSVDDVEALAASGDDVITCVNADLSAELMQRLYLAPGSACAPGVICAPSAAELQSVCVQQAAKLARARDDKVTRVFVYPEFDVDHVEQGTDLILGGTADRERLRSALSSEAAVLAIFPHSDGIDFSVSSRQFACPFINRPAVRGELRPHCQVVGRCTRFRGWPTVADARDAGWIVPLSVIRAQIGIVFSCNVARLPDGVIDNAYSLAAALLEQADLGVLITTWRRERSSPDGAILNQLINDISSGTAVGPAVQLFNSSDAAARLGAKLCVIGDPRFSLPPQQSACPLPAPRLSATTRPARVSPPENAADAEISLLRAAIRRSMRVSADFDVDAGSRLDAVLSSRSDVVPEGQQYAAQDIDEMLLRFLSAAPRLEAMFSPFSHDRDLNENGVCPICFAPAHEFQMTFPRYGARSRNVVRCPGCGDSVNVPSTWKISIKSELVPMGIVDIAGTSPGTLGQMSLISLAPSARPMSGPVYATCNPITSRDRHLVFHLPDEVPNMPILCHILMVHRLEIGTVACKLRRLDDGTLLTSLTRQRRKRDGGVIRSTRVGTSAG